MIKKLFEHPNFNNQLEATENKTWTSIKLICSNFLGNHRSDDHKKIIEDLIVNLKEQGCREFLKVHMLNKHLDKFAENCGKFSDEQGERFHQDISFIEERYPGRWNRNMLADFCWLNKKETDFNFKYGKK